MLFQDHENVLVKLKNKNYKELKKSRDSESINKHQDFPEDKMHQSGDDCIENVINEVTQNNQPLNKKPVFNQI